MVVDIFSECLLVFSLGFQFGFSVVSEDINCGICLLFIYLRSCIEQRTTSLLRSIAATPRASKSDSGLSLKTAENGVEKSCSWLMISPSLGSTTVV